MMDQKTIKRKPTKCIVPSCSYNKPNPVPNSRTLPPNPPNWREITGETKLFYNPVLQRQYGSSKDQIKLMVCENHFLYHEHMKNLELQIERAPSTADLTEQIKEGIQETGKNYEIMAVLNVLFEPLIKRLSKTSRKSADKLSEDEADLVIKQLEFLKLIMRNFDNKKSLLELGLPEVLVVYLETNELKSSKDDENHKVLLVALCMLLFTSFCMIEEDKLNELRDRVLKVTWSYLSMDVPELQHQTIAFLWSLLNGNEAKYRLKLRRDVKFFIMRFNEYKVQWRTQTLELFVAFLASVLFHQDKEMFIEMHEQEKNNIKECIEYLDDCRSALSDKGKYFTERVVSFLQPTIADKPELSRYHEESGSA